MKKFELVAPYKPMGDQIQAIERITSNLEMGIKEQTLLGATGTGKTFTMANVIANVNKPTLVLAHNKTLAGQLYAELKAFFPNNRVEYFISYYDYYQPEAYVPSKDMYIEKDSSINDEIDQMRHAATSSILERRDTIIVASVSCIYGIGDPEDYENSMLTIRVNDNLRRDDLIDKLVKQQFIYSSISFERGMFRVKGDHIDILPTYENSEAIRISFFDDEVEKIAIFDVATGKIIRSVELINIFPATHFVMNEEKKEEAMRRIKQELDERIAYFLSINKPLEAERIKQRTMYDLEMLKEVGSCSGIENYSRHLSLRNEGETPSVLLDFFDKDYLMIIDESHVTIPQVRGMYNGDRSRKQTLVDYGFRLPSALDNRPLNFEEFEQKINQVVYVSATPGDYELSRSYEIIEQIIRPTGLLDPLVEVRPTLNQIDYILADIKERIKNNERTLITTLTIKMSEDLTAYLKEVGIKVAYLHSEIKALERLEIIRALRKGTYDVLVGINLLREGLDIPEVSLICILDADKEGFLRSERSLIQTIGRAARNANGKVVLYADTMTDSMTKAINETNRRRKIQNEYNIEHHIIPQTIIKEIGESVSIVNPDTGEVVEDVIDKETYKSMSKVEKKQLIEKLELAMKKASKELNFEEAIMLRDTILELKAEN
ncbi:MAG: excinuclease ABC subunit UvrB [Bacilli bacterium]|nr:excinuclease ABC subunit UvrB [Bacilli bacterium]MDD7314150.1 excinuclease ABC subunit UvrB [Bacilli bacterium]MDY4052285.1 excinuclease ABC subunit UvrB [Bacilli bacterium]